MVFINFLNDGSIFLYVLDLSSMKTAIKLSYTWQ